mgnify:CR=1 FL=1
MSLSRYRLLTRNLSIATTAATVLISGLAQVEILRFLEPAQIPMVVASSLCLAGFYMIQAMSAPAKGSGRQIASTTVRRGLAAEIDPQGTSPTRRGGGGRRTR